MPVVVASARVPIELLLLELIRQWRADGGVERVRCADDLERLLEAFARGVLDELTHRPS